MSQPNSDLNDDQLMAALAEGHLWALEALGDRHGDWVQSLIRDILGDPDAAEDLSQEVFLRVHEQRSNYEPSGAFTQWLARIARNLALNEAKRRGLVTVEPFEEEREAAVGISFPAFLSGTTPLETLEKEELAQEVREAVESLPADQRIALVMRHYGDMTYKDIAWALGSPIGTVKSRVFQALAALRSRLAPIVEEVHPKMKCEEARQLLPDLFYEEVTEKKAQELKEHLRLCRACRAERKGLKTLLNALTQARPEPFRRLIAFEPDDGGNLLLRCVAYWPNRKEEPVSETEELYVDPRIVTERVKDGKGRDLPFTIGPRADGNLGMKVRFWERVEPGEHINIMVTARLRGAIKASSGEVAAGLVSTPAGETAVHFLDAPTSDPGDPAALAISVFRLPKGAEIHEVDPQPDEIVTEDETCLLVWERHLEPKEQFKCRVVYDVKE